MRKRKFVKLYHEYHEPIYRFIYFRVRTSEIAEDITSDVFLNSFNYFKKVKPKNPRAVLYKIARNLIAGYYRKNRDIKLDLEIQAEDKHFIDLDNALKKLKKEHREIIVLYYLEGFSTSEISKIIDKKENSINIILHRARKKLKEFV